jgi:hypothetical protein
MANLPAGASTLPGVTTDVITQTSGVSVPGGTRLALLVGTGARTEVIVASAVGSGNDGLNSTYTSVTGRDGRHFTLKNAPIVANRTQLFKNGVPLTGIEEVPDSDPFDNRYDYRVDISTGQIELQTAYLIDQGGTLYGVGATNVGLGNLDGYSGPDLEDLNAPTETWTLKCVSVQRSTLGAPVQDTAKFIAFGSVSGVKLDSNGSPVTWIANGQEVSNGIIKLAISETKSLGSSVSPFREGDYFTLQVKSGSLNKNDTLTASYIAETDLNDPEFFTSMEQLAAKHGSPSTDNTLSLGASLSFANSPPGVFALQSKPALPRRTSYVLVDSFDATSTDVNDFIIPLPLGVVPDLDSSIHVFTTNPTTRVETQLLPNKYPFYTLDTSGDPTTEDFVFSDTDVPAGWSFSYSVNEAFAALNFGSDGYLNRSLSSPTLATFSVAGTTFTSSYVGKTVKIYDATNPVNDGTWDVVSVTDGKLGIQATGATPFDVFVNDTGVSFHVINPVTGATVASSTATDGAIVASPGTIQATFSSAAINFTALATLTGLKLRVTSSATDSNEGLFDILSVDGSDNLTISKSFLSESALDYEVLDPDQESHYLVLNHNVVPDGHSLRVSLIDNKDADFFDAGWVEALEKLETIEFDILVPLPQQTMSVIFQNCLNHCITMSNLRNKKERVMFTGAIRGLTPENLTGAESAAVEDIGILEGIQGDNVAEILAGNTEDLTNYSVADGFGHTFRAMYFYPDEIVAVVGGENTIIDGFYIGAAAAGLVSGTANIAMPLTQKVISGFNILRDKTLSVTTMEQLAAAGVAVVQPVAGGGRVIWGKTTTQSGFPEEEEISIVFIRDRIAKSLRTGFAGFIGIPEDPDVIPMLTTRAVGLLQSFIGQKIITDFTNLVVRRDSVDSRQWNVSVRVQPNYPVNWIYIKVGLGTI